MINELEGAYNLELNISWKTIFNSLSSILI